MLKDISRDDLYHNLDKLGLSRIITIATSNKNFDIVQDIQKERPNIYYTLGTHPHEAKGFQPEDIEFIKKFFSDEDKKLVAIGEIGLDYHYDFSPERCSDRCF